MSIEQTDLTPLSVKRSLGLILLSTALVLIPSIITSKRITVKVPKPSIALGRLEPTAEATSIQDLIVDDPVIVPEPAIQPVQEPVVAEVIPTPPPVEKPVTEAPVQPKMVGSGSCEAEIYKYDWNHSVALAVARAESGLNPGSLNNNPRTKDYSVGCFQINLYGANAKSRPSEATLKQASENVAFAYRIYKSNGSSFKGQWGVCRKISCY